ncbi:hypothetical protein [Nitrosarchaeum sp. AC2]|uniref:hypothetical protein n=1 Tax=Nitrosarchaeum sp. AC2 TaxID=2259673 RepID=UPI0015C97A1A|nr:hypothetical protein [Nitrosarchaeum sp. AC2]QLH11246.1 hypothetical protein DSQ20_07080 [Nitrosarchaeum sp. AC2]
MKSNILKIIGISFTVLILIGVVVLYNETYYLDTKGIIITPFSDEEIKLYLDEFNILETDVVKITDEDLDNVPIIEKLIHQVDAGSEDNLDRMTGLSESELIKYKEWIDGKEIFKGHPLFEYNSKYYRIQYWINQDFTK